MAALSLSTANPSATTPAMATARDSMSIGYGPRTAQPFGTGQGVSNFGALAMFRAMSHSSPSHAPVATAPPPPVPAVAPASAPALESATSAELCMRCLHAPESMLDVYAAYTSGMTSVFPTADASHKAPEFSPTRMLIERVQSQRPDRASRSSRSRATSGQPPTPSLLAGSDSDSPPSTSERGSPDHDTSFPHLPNSALVGPHQTLALPALDPAAALEAAEAARMLASHPSWELYAHLIGAPAPTTADPSQLMFDEDASLAETGGKRKRDPFHGALVPSSFTAEGETELRSSVPAPSPSPRASGSSKALDTDPEDFWFGSSEWVPPKVPVTRDVDWTTLERAVAAGAVPRKVEEELRKCHTVRTGPYDRPHVGTRPGAQPHLDKLRQEVLSGQRPDLVTMYINKLRPKLTPAARRGEGGGPPRLSKAEKKKNHLASEHKRRSNIRRGYQDLASVVPALQHFSRQEIKVGISMESQYLHKTVEHMRHLVEINASLASKRVRILGLLGRAYGVELLRPAPAEEEITT